PPGSHLRYLPHISSGTYSFLHFPARLTGKKSYSYFLVLLKQNIFPTTIGIFLSSLNIGFHIGTLTGLQIPVVPPHAPCVTMPYMCLFTFLRIFRLKGACLGDGINAHLFGMPILSLFPPPTFSSKMDDAFLYTVG